jgi:transcription termination/antitermination protein NusG
VTLPEASDESPAEFDGMSPSDSSSAEQSGAVVEETHADGRSVELQGLHPDAVAAPTEAPRKIKKPVVDVVAADSDMDWYILKVAFNREDTIREALEKRVKMEGMEEYFEAIVVPTEDVAEFTRSGKRRITKRKLLPGYLMVRMIINDDTWFLVRETAGISDFTGAAGKPMPMDPADVERFINKPVLDDDDEVQIKTAIPYRSGDRVRVKEGHFENQEGEIDTIDEANGRVTVIISIFGRSVPMELDHWQVEAL